MEISCIVSPQKPESIFCSLRHNSLRVSNENFFPDRHSTIFRCENCHIRGNLFAIGMNKIQNYWNFKHEIESMREKPGKCFKCFSSCHNSSPERIFSSFLFFLSLRKQPKSKTIETIFFFYGFFHSIKRAFKTISIPLLRNNLFALSTRILANIFPFAPFFSFESFYREMKEKKMF